MSLPAARVAEGQNVFAPAQKFAVEQCLHLARRLGRQSVQIEVGQGFFQRQFGYLQEPRDSILASLLTFAFHNLQQILFITQRFLFSSPCPFFETVPDRRQVQLAQIAGQVFLNIARSHHRPAPGSAPASSSASKLAKSTSGTAISVAAGKLVSLASKSFTALAFNLPSPISPSSSR